MSCTVDDFTGLFVSQGVVVHRLFMCKLMSVPQIFTLRYSTSNEIHDVSHIISLYPHGMYKPTLLCTWVQGVMIVHIKTNLIMGCTLA